MRAALSKIRTPDVRRFVAEQQLHPMVERRAVAAYATLAISLAAGLTGLLLQGFQFGRGSFHYFPIVAAFVGGAFGLRRLGHPKVAGIFDALALLYGFGIVCMLAVVAGGAASGPFADHLLHRADLALGFDTKAYVLATRPFFVPLQYAYFSFLWQGIAIALMLVGSNQLDRFYQFLTANTFALALTCAIFPLVPALGSFTYLGITPQVYPEFGGNIGPWHFGHQIELLKNGYRILDNRVVGALISFPSYHAAAAVLFMWAGWRSRFRIPLIALNVALLCGTPVLGAHYLVDLIGGAAVGVAGIFAAQICIRSISR